MDAVFCVAKIRDEHGKIIEYRMRDTSGGTIDISATALKGLMECNKIRPANITLTRDGRLITSGKHVNDISINNGHEVATVIKQKEFKQRAAKAKPDSNFDEAELLTDEQRDILSSLISIRGRDSIIEDTIDDLYKLVELLKKRRDLCRKAELPTMLGRMPYNAEKVDRYLAEEISETVADAAIAIEILAMTYCRVDIKEKINTKISTIADNIAKYRR